MPIEKITHMGEHRKEKVADLVQQARDKHWTMEYLSGQLKRLANTPTKRDTRNWKSVARTELTDANATQSFDAIIEKYGRRAQVVRITGDACEACLHAFGSPKSPRVWAAGMVPDHLKGAVHTNCKCSEWRMIGMVKKAECDEYHRSNGAAMFHEGMMHLPQNPHEAANHKAILLSAHEHLKNCTEENCECCKKMHQLLQKRTGRGIAKAFQRPTFVKKMKFVIHHILKPKKVRGLPHMPDKD
jgi:hypothetical protein